MQKQQCNLAGVWISWAAYLAAIPFLFWYRGWIAALWIAIAGGGAWWAYVRGFARVSRFLGYGRVDDEPARRGPVAAPPPTRVTLYTAAGCPFCPIVARRLRALAEEWGFELEEVDLALHPGRADDIRAVPVVEARGRRIVGHATTRELAELILGPAGVEAREPALVPA